MDEQLSEITGNMEAYLQRLAICIGIGLLIGMERTFHRKREDDEEFAGIRTFTLVAVFGYLSALLATYSGAWLLGVSLAGLILFVVVSYYRSSVLPGKMGGTTEIAAILTFLLGALVFGGFILLSLVVTVVTLLLLAYKPTLHGFVNKLSREELLAIIKFIIISALVIPFLPTQNFGPYGIWNLQDIWKMVILVSGVSLVGYLIAKIVGHKGTMLAGVIGGLVSSTAVALTYSRRSKEAKDGAGALYFAMAIISACTIMFPRILVEVYIVNRALAEQLWIPIAILSLTGFGAAFYVYRKNLKDKSDAQVPLSNPLNFGTALKFALFFAAVLLLVRYSNENFGDSGTYIAGAISGITDVDAITLSMARLATNDATSTLAMNTILLAALSNTLVKLGIVLVVGSRSLVKASLPGFIAIFSVGTALFLYYLLR